MNTTFAGKEATMMSSAILKDRQTYSKILGVVHDIILQVRLVGASNASLSKKPRIWLDDDAYLAH